MKRVILLSFASLVGAAGGGCRDEEAPSTSVLPPAVTKAGEDEVGGSVRLAARLSIVRVVDEDPVLADLPGVVEADEVAKAAGVSVEVDHWYHGSDGGVHMPYLVAADRAALASYLGGLQQRHPELKPAEGQGFAFASVTKNGAKPKWRSYLVDRRQGISPRELKGIEIDEDETGTFALQVEFTATDGEAFTTLTKETVGHKLAIMVGDRVVSAPLVWEAIPGNRVVVTPGVVNDSTRGRAEVEALAKQLRGE